MKVKFSKQYFGPDGARYRKGEHEVPDAWEGKLPKTATVIEPPAGPPPPKKGLDSIPTTAAGKAIPVNPS